MRENCTSGSAQGAPGNGRSYCEIRKKPKQLLKPQRKCMNSYLELSKFIEHHTLDSDSVGTCRFSAFVDYESAIRGVTTDTNITIMRHSIKDGNVELEEQANMDADSYHLDLSAKFQQYGFFKNSGKLQISGYSQNMGGDYTVTIFPKT